MVEISLWIVDKNQPVSAGLVLWSVAQQLLLVQLIFLFGNQ